MDVKQKILQLIASKTKWVDLKTAIALTNYLVENKVTIPVRCGECAHSINSKSIPCAYKCILKRSPCYGRTTFADFGCLYAEPK